MTSLLQKLVMKKLGRLRMMTLIVMCALAVGLASEHLEAVSAAADPLPLDGWTVALDPGHGGYDGGARAHDSGRWEKELTLRIALEAEKALAKRGARVILTRRDDVCLAEGDTATKARKRADLQKRLDIAKAAGADVFISIHLNDYRSRQESGPQSFYQHGAEAGRLLACAMQEALVKTLEPGRVRTAMAGDYYVLRGPLPSVLVECGFVSNSQEEKQLLDPSYQQRVGEAVAQGMENYALLAPESRKPL